MSENPTIRAALVSTNSVTQGEQVADLRNPLMESGVPIDFTDMGIRRETLDDRSDFHRYGRSSLPARRARWITIGLLSVLNVVYSGYLLVTDRILPTRLSRLYGHYMPPLLAD